MCFAYKSDQSIEQIRLTLYDTLKLNYYSVSVSYNGIGDMNWHYDCVDLYSKLGSKINPTNSKVYDVRIL